MKIFALSIVFLFSVFTLNAQFYYQDILVTKQTNLQYNLYRSLETRKITAISYDGDEISEDFVLEQIFSVDGKQVVTRTASINNEESYFISSYNNNRLFHTVDSSKNAIAKERKGNCSRNGFEFEHGYFIWQELKHRKSPE